MSVAVTFHCDLCRDLHDLKQRLSVYDNLINKEDAKERKNLEIIRKLKRNRQEVTEEIDKIEREHNVLEGEESSI